MDSTQGQNLAEESKGRGPPDSGGNERLLESVSLRVLFSLPPRLRASIRTFNPRQLKYEDKSDTKFKFSTFNKNVNRVKAVAASLGDPEVILREIG